MAARKGVAGTTTPSVANGLQRVSTQLTFNILIFFIAIDGIIIRIFVFMYSICL